MKTETPDIAGGLDEALCKLRDQGAANFDPNRLHLITELAQRAKKQRPAVARLLQEKARGRLDAYQQAFLQAKNNARELLSALQINFPDQREDATELYEGGKFQALERLAQDLEHQAGNTPLQQLLEVLDSGSVDRENSEHGDSAADILRQQELELVPPTAVDAPTKFTPPTQLRSARHCRDALAQLEAEQRVARACRSAPEDSGPLNPHKLATRSLLLMRDLSPAYLGRFIAYLDTLAWLEDKAPDATVPPEQNGLKT